MLEALEYSHFISFLLKRPHWDNKFDSCPCPPKSPEDLKLNLRSFQRGWVPEVFCFHSVSSEPFSHIRFLGWSLLLPKTLIVIAASRIPSPGIFHRNKSQQMYDCTPLPVWVFFPLAGTLWRITVLWRKACWKWKGDSLPWEMINMCL